MCGLIDDISSAFSAVGDAVSGWFGSGGSDAASAVGDAASAAGDAASAASDLSAGTSAAANASSGFNFASDAANTAATSGDAISNAASYLDSNAAATYTAGMSTGDFGQGFNFATDSTPGTMDAYSGIGNISTNPNEPAYTNMALLTADQGPAAAQQAAGQSWWSKTFGSAGTTAGASSTGIDNTLSKMMMSQMVGGLITGAIQAGGAYLASKPRAPANFGGRTPGGGGGGLRMTTTGGGFGLQQGGTEAAPTGVPSALAPNPQAEALGGSGGGTHVATPPTGQGGGPNIQQNIANQAGFGGLIPQGSVNYMKGGPNG